MENSVQSPANARYSISSDAPSVGALGDKSEEEASKVGCGWGRCRPAVLARFAHVWTFIVFYLIFSFTHGVQGSYTISVLTTLERRFKLPSFLAGALVTVSTVGYMASTVFVSFFFAKKNQPRLFAGCMLLTSLCALLYVIPHVVYGTGNDSIDSEHAQRQDLFNSTAPSEGGNETVQLCADGGDIGGGLGEDEGRCSAAMKQEADEGVAYVMPAMALFAASEILQGIAGAPVWTVGMAFIDDHTNPELSAKLIGLMFTMRFVSPMISFAMGGYLLSIYANLRETDLTAEDPRWIGAWWIGFLICSITNFAICIPTSMIPNTLQPIRSKIKAEVGLEVAKEDRAEIEGEEKNETTEQDEKKEKLEVGKDGKQEKQDEEENEKKEEGKEEDQEIVKKDGEEETDEEQKKVTKIVVDVKTSKCVPSTAVPPQESSVRPSNHLADWKEMIKSMRRLLTNPIYMLASIAICIDCLILGFIAFLPKYFEVYFHKTASVANILGGMIPAIFAGCASYIGGLVSGKIKGIDGGVAGLSLMNSSLSLIGLLFLMPAMFLSCPDLPYSGHLIENRLNLTTDCNVNCGCSLDVFDPVCGNDGFQYFSSCHAGCTQFINLNADPSDVPGRLVRAVECRCISDAESRDGDDEGGRVVFAGFCGVYCASLIPYVLILVVISFSINMYNVPCTTIILRCVREEDKSFALGLQTFGICLTVLPAPLLYGNVFDASCVLKETKSCTDNEGACLFYDRDALRLAFHGLTIGLHTVATILYYVTYFLARRKLSLITALHNAQLIGENALGASRLLVSAEKPSEITEITYL